VGRQTGHGALASRLVVGRQVVSGSCRSCHGALGARGRTEDVVAMAPLSVAPWIVTIRQAEAEAYRSTFAVRRVLYAAAPILLLVAAGLALGTAWSVRTPLTVLTNAAEAIARGRLSDPIPPLGDDEIGRLGRSLDQMRAALGTSLDEVELANRDLEQRVEARTAELRELYRQLEVRDRSRAELLRKVITAQEEERKRIARELHDETCQTIVALGMALGMANGAQPDEQGARLAEARTLSLRALDELHRIMFDLRPSVLDDLGLIPAIRWYAERRLVPLGIDVRVEVDEAQPRLPAGMEVTLFRVVQEAIANIERHAQAEQVLIQIARDAAAITIEIEDDGVGFEPARYRVARESGEGLGLLGMRERVELLGGTVDVDSAPGAGARVVVRVPLQTR
jgi:signal transduction histidine kinase